MNLNIINKIGAVLFCSVLITMGVFAVVLPKKGMSEYEKRELAKMPEFTADSLFSGKYTKDIDAYYADNFPFRDKFIELSAFIREWRGIKLDGATIYGDVPVDVDDGISGGKHETNSNSSNLESSVSENKPDGEASSIQENSSPDIPENENTDVYGEQINGLFITNGRAMGLFGGNKNVAERYAGLINEFQKSLENSTSVYSMIVPTSADFYIPQKYKNLSTPQKDNIDYIYSCLNASVIPSYAYEEIQKHSAEYIYFNTDHHWTGLGAYYAYVSFAQAAGFTPKLITDFEKRRIPGDFLGTFYSQTKSTALKNNPDYVDYYVIPGAVSARRYDRRKAQIPSESVVWYENTGGIYSYGVFLGGDFPMLEITTGNENGKSIAVVKESFGNAFAPFLISHYEKIYVIDMRYFESNLISFIKNNNISELLFINNVFAANTAVRVDDIERLLKVKY